MAACLLTLCLLLWASDVGPEVSSFRLPVVEHLATFAGRPFWSSGRSQSLTWGRNARTDSAQVPTLGPEALASSVQFAEGVVSRLARLETTLVGSDVRVRPGSPAHGQLIAGLPGPAALERHREAQVALRASQYIADNNCRRFDLKERRCGELVNSLSLKNTPLGATCEARDVTCGDARFRSLDGSCNNEARPGWGRALTGYRRMAKPQYGDGLQTLRRSEVRGPGESLPGARQVSSTLGADKERVDRDLTLAVMQWAQFVGLDLAHTPTVKMTSTGSSISCCKPDGGALRPRSLHPSCAPIYVPRDDPVFRGRRCLDYVRSLTAPRPDCRFGPAEQMNQATHWLDGSMIYGNGKDASLALRSLKDGKLLTSEGPGRELLPLSADPTTACQLINKPLGPCFRAGDSRVNEQPSLTALHTLWVREHNRLAGALQLLNPRWDDERTFQEARRLVGAELQHVTYRAWLPIVVGEGYARQMGVNSAGYAPNVDPAIRNSFATAALQFVYSMMSGKLELHGEERRSNDSLRLRDHFNRPAVLSEPGRLDQLVRALATQGAQKIDLQHTEDVTSALFAGGAGELGLDALSQLIQRGRDHGLPGYNTFRAACGLSTAQSIDDFTDLIPRAVVSQLKTMYAHPGDVDLYVGAMSERPAEGALLGPTFRCIVAKQLLDTRRADRFFYDLPGQPGSFSTAQLAEVRKASLARVFCDNGDQISTMQPNVFLKPSRHAASGPDNNGLVSCADLPAIDLAPWTDSAP